VEKGGWRRGWDSNPSCIENKGVTISKNLKC
jgi:hypothetical protein